MRLCNLASIPAVRPFDQNSASALLRIVLITAKCKPTAYESQLLADKARKIPTRPEGANPE